MHITGCSVARAELGLSGRNWIDSPAQNACTFGGSSLVRALPGPAEPCRRHLVEVVDRLGQRHKRWGRGFRALQLSFPVRSEMERLGLCSTGLHLQQHEVPHNRVSCTQHWRRHILRFSAIEDLLILFFFNFILKAMCESRIVQEIQDCSDMLVEWQKNQLLRKFYRKSPRLIARHTETLNDNKASTVRTKDSVQHRTCRTVMRRKLQFSHFSLDTMAFVATCTKTKSKLDNDAGSFLLQQTDVPGTVILQQWAIGTTGA